MHRAMDKASDAKPTCDLNIVSCTLVDLYAGRFLPDSVVSIRDGMVVGVNDGLQAAETIDLGGRFLAPGLIDAHVHIESSLLCPAEYAKVVLPRGTTTVVADPHEIVNVMGYDGMRFMLAASEGLPLDVRFMVPSCVPATEFDTAGSTLYASDMYPFLRDGRVLGLGEVMNYPGILARDPRLMDKLALFRSAGKPVDGHAPGLRGPDLSAYIRAGIGSDHECTTPEEAQEKLSKGMYIMLREGSTAKDLHNLIPALTPANSSRFMLCSDDRHSNDLRDEGHMDHALRLLLKSGMDRLDALRIASANAAQWFGMTELGAIAPGKRADFVAFSSFEDFRAEMVFASGRLAAKDGKLVSEIRSFQPSLRDSVNIKWLGPEDFHIPAPESQTDQEGKIRVIETRKDSLLTACALETPKMESGFCVSDTVRDIIKIFVVERHTGSGRIGKGFVRGLGLKRGAIGGTISHDSHNMIIAGADDASIFKAARHLNKIKGGLVFAIGDRVILDLPLPVAGLMSDKDADWVIERLRAFDEVFAAEGLSNSSPLMTLSFMALPVIPSLRITDRGLIDVDGFAPVELFA